MGRRAFEHGSRFRSGPDDTAKAQSRPYARLITMSFRQEDQEAGINLVQTSAKLISGSSVRRWDSQICWEASALIVKPQAMP